MSRMTSLIPSRRTTRHPSWPPAESPPILDR
jgi:hypothetical protein